MLICKVGEKIDKSPFKNEYVMSYMEISRNTLSNWRNGKVYPPTPKLFKLAKLLNVKVDELYEWKDE